jgi:hypothetical protein
MSRKERVVTAIRLVIAAAPTERLLRAAAQVRSGLAERVLAGVLLAVAVAGAVLIPRLLVGPSPQHALGVGAPSVTGPPVVLAPGLPAQKSQPQAAAGPQDHATHLRVFPSASTSQPAAQPRPATSPAVHGPPPRTQPLPQPQPRAQPDTPPMPHALAPTPLAPKHPVRTPKLPKPQHEPKAPPPPKPQDKPKPNPQPQPQPQPQPGPKPKRHPDHAKPAHVPPPPESHPDHPKHPDHAKPTQTPPPEPSQEPEPHGHGNGHKQ